MSYKFLYDLRVFSRESDGTFQPRAERLRRGLWKPSTYSKIAISAARRVGIKPIRIYPGSPWENGYDERFNGTLRREVLNAEWFTTTEPAQIVINHWLKQYNHTRPHQALNMQPPVPETVLEKMPVSGPETGG